jgi:hypothetical protein
MPDTPALQPEPGGPLAPVEAALRRTRRTASILLVTTGLAGFLAGGVAVAIAAGVLDYFFRVPLWFRLAVWAAGIVGGVWAAKRWVVPALRFRPSLTEVALRLERSDAGRKAGLGGVLASGLELQNDPTQTTAGRWMAGHVVEEAGQRFSAARLGSLLDLRGMRDALLTLAVVLVACGTLAWVIGPRLFGIGIARVLAPWAGAEWPKRTELADATGATVHPLGTALPLRVALVRTDRGAGATRIAARYRIVGGGEDAATVRRVLLTGQGRSVTVPDASGEGKQGELYERLIDPAVLGTTTAAELEYWFETDDDRTEARRITLVQPPAVISAQVTVTPPEYASGAGGTRQAFVSGRLDLGPGNDQRAVVGPVLGGSEVELSVKLNKAVPAAPEDAEARKRWFSAALPGLDPASVAAEFAGTQWKLAWKADKALRLPMRPRDDYGLTPADESAFAFDVVEDRPPTATVTEPRADEAVLASAVVDAAGEGRDDVGLSDVRLQAQNAIAAKGSIGAAPEPTGEPTVVAAATGKGLGGEGEAGPPTQASVRAQVDLSKFDLKPGDELWLTALAADNYALGGNRHEAVRSAPRKLRVIREEDLIEQVRAELAAVRKIAVRLDEEQAELRKATQAGAVSADDRRRQAGLTQRITQQNETVQRLSQRVERNRLKDEAITGLLQDVGTLLQGAASDSEQAAAKMDAAARQAPEAEKTPLTPEQQEKVGKSQEAVRDQLGRLAEMLDKGEDSWLVSRNLQRLLEQQRDLQARTQRAGEQTMGKKAQDLTPQERSELAQIADQQERLSEAARQAIDNLSERAKQMEKADSVQAEGMRRAAERGRQQQVPQKMSEASRSVQQNQTSTAEQQQQDAAQALEQMVQDLNEAQKNRDDHLKRVLASIIESLEKLIQQQDAQIAALGAAGADPASLDGPMIELNKNTLDVAGQARGDRAMARIAELVDRAASNQGTAIGALRAKPVDADGADKSEREALRLLKLARDEARKQEQEAQKRDQDKKRRELRRAYRDALEQEVALKGETDPFIGKAVDRRDRMKVRGLGERQDTVRATLEDLRKKTQELTEATVFDYAHTRLDQATSTAAKKLRAGTADRAVSRHQDSAITILKSLVEALDDRAKQDDEFKDDSAGGGGGGGGGQQPLIPPLAELRLLRAMQQEAADVTRTIDDAKDAAPDELVGLGDLQKSLSDRGKELIQKLQGPGGGGPEKPEKPGKD